jgi:thymidylate synthase (FAD)
MKISKMGVLYVDHMGSDVSVVNSARVSTANDNRFKTEIDSKDEGLIRYLARFKHNSPFMHNSITLKLKVPIFVARQLAKHQVGGVINEVSRRYVDEEPEFYFPDSWRARPEKSIKQGSGGVIDFDDSFMYDAVQTCLDAYNHALDNGVAPELARMVLPQNMMTEFYWTGSLFFFDRVRYFRVDHHAQEESRQIGNMIATECEKLFPVSWKELGKNKLTPDPVTKSFWTKVKELFN